MKKLLLPLAFVLLAGCAYSQPAAVVPNSAQAVTDSIDMTSHLAVTNQDGYRIMATQTAYNLADIDHVTLTLYRSSGNATGP